MNVDRYGVQPIEGLYHIAIQVQNALVSHRYNIVYKGNLKREGLFELMQPLKVVQMQHETNNAIYERLVEKQSK